MTENEMVGWHHRFNVHELGQTLVDGEGQGGLSCCSPWGCKEMDVTWRLNTQCICLNVHLSATTVTLSRDSISAVLVFRC